MITFNKINYLKNMVEFKIVMVIAIILFARLAIRLVIGCNKTKDED